MKGALSYANWAENRFSARDRQNSLPLAGIYDEVAGLLGKVHVLPAFQGKGLGKRIMTAIMASIEAHAHPEAFIGLMAAKGVEDFYTQFGFSVCPPERPGMFRSIEGNNSF